MAGFGRSLSLGVVYLLMVSYSLGLSLKSQILSTGWSFLYWFGSVALPSVCYGVGAVQPVLLFGVVGVLLSLAVIIAFIPIPGCVLGSIVYLVSRRSACPTPFGVVLVYSGKYNLYLWVRNSVSMPLLASSQVLVSLALHVSISSIFICSLGVLLGRSCHVWA